MAGDRPTPFSLSDELAAWLAAIIESSDDAIISKTLDGVITSWNPGAARIFGYSAEEAIGRPVTLVIPPDRWAEEEQVLARLRRGERVDHFETVRRAKDGHAVDVSLTVSPVRNAEGRIVGVSKIARDISERRRAEVERTVLLKRAEEARAEAEAVNRGKDEFLATISHELRTPLNAIFGWAKMLADGELDAAATARAAQVILRNAQAQVQLIEDLFDVSRIITGNMRLDLRPLDPKAVMEAALDAVRPAATAKDLSLQSALSPRAGPIMGAPERLQQIVWNLLINAVKFTPRGGRVEATLHRVDSRVEIIVSDTGEGIPPHVLPHIFERFHQGESGSARRHGGLGIGLALVRHLVDLHGGSVRAESPGVGRGATFTVTLPVPSVVAAAPPQEQVSIAPPLDPRLYRLNVLVVDDDADGLEMSRRILMASGAEVRTSTSSSAALGVLNSTWWPDVLVADIEMPGEDGFSLLRKARALASTRGRPLPAIALTAYGRVGDRLRILASGFNLHLVKPVDPSELRLSVANLTGRTG